MARGKPVLLLLCSRSSSSCRKEYCLRYTEPHLRRLSNRYQKPTYLHVWPYVRVRLHTLHPLYPVPVIGESLDCVNCTTHRLLQYLGAGVEVIITLASSFVGQYI